MPSRANATRFEPTITECLTLRVKDVDLERRELLVRRGKAGKDRVTVLPDSAGARWKTNSGGRSCCTITTWRRGAGGSSCREG